MKHELPKVALPERDFYPITSSSYHPSKDMLPVISVTVVFLLVIGGMYLYFQNVQLQKEIEQLRNGSTTKTIISPIVSPTPLPKNIYEEFSEYQNWKIYTQSDIHLSFQYPNDWVLTEHNFNTKDDYSKGGWSKVTVKGKEGEIGISWGSGFGGGCEPENKVNVKLQNTTLQGCSAISNDGLTRWWATYGKLQNGMAFGLDGTTANPDIQQNFALKTPATVVQVNFDTLSQHAIKDKRYEPLPKHPAIVEHFTFFNDNQVPAADMLKTANNAHNLIKSVQIIDAYENKLSLEVSYLDKTRNLTDEDVKPARKDLVKAIEKLGMKLQGEV